MKLQGASTPRPMTHDLMVDVLGELEAKCTQVAVTELRDNTFFATVTLTVDGKEIEIDSRPERRARARRPRRRADLRRRGGHRRVRDRVRARGRGHRGGRRPLQGVPRRGLAGGLRRGFLRLRPPGRTGRQSRPDQSLVRRASSTIRATSASNPTPAASAAWGSRLVSVRPGIAFASITQGVPSLVEQQVHAGARAQPEQLADPHRDGARRARRRVVQLAPGSGTSCGRSCTAPRSRRRRSSCGTASTIGSAAPPSTEIASSRPRTWRSNTTLSS